MKRILFLLFFLHLVVTAQQPIVPPGFPYVPLPIPTSGSTPGTTTRVPGTINRTGYSDNPSMWYPFIGGAQQYFGTTNDMNNFNPKSRIEMQTAWVKDFGYGTNVNGLFMLKNGIANSNWLLIGSITNGVFVPTGGSGANIYNSDGTVLDDIRVVGGKSTNNIVFQNFNTFDILSTDNIFATASETMELAGPTFLRLTSDNIWFASSNIVSTNALNGWVWTLTDFTKGAGEWLPGGGGGQNFANTDLTLTGNRIHDGNGDSVIFSNFDSFSVVASSGNIDFSSLSLFSSSADQWFGEGQTGVSLYLTGPDGNGSGFFSQPENVQINAATVSDGLYVITPGVAGFTNNTVGWALTLSNTNGLVEFKPPSGGGGVSTNIGNSDLTITDPLRILNGGGNDLLFTNLVNLEFFADTAAGLGSSGLARTYGQDAFLYSFAGAQFKANNSGSATISGPGNVIIQPPTIYDQTATLGQVMTLINTNGTAEWATITGGTNYFNITNTYVAENFANTDLTFTGSRTHDIAGNQLTIENASQVTWTGMQNFTVFANNAFMVDSSNTYGFQVQDTGGVTIFTTGPNPYGDPGQVLTSDGSNDYWADPPAGQNFANADLTLTGNRVQTGAGNDFNFNGVGIMTLSGDNMVLGGGTSFQIQSPSIVATTAVNGQVFTLLDATNGTVDWADAPAGQNISNADLTSDGDHTLNVDGHSLTVNGFTSATISASTNSEVVISSAGTTITANGSNVINLHSDAINQSTATVGQVWTLQNSTTGAGEWADGTSPAGGNVKTVDTIADLLAENTALVITQGYYSVGDGGHAAYRYVSGDSTATNTVTVFEGASGRYFLMQSGSISAKQAGAIGDGSTDDHDALQALLDNCANLTARIEPLSYRSTAGLILPDHVKVIARGATVTVETTGSDRAVDMGSWCEWVGGTVIDAYQSGGDGSSNDHCPFRFGDYLGVVNSGVSNSILREVTIDVSGDYPAVSVLVTQSSNNILIAENVIPSSSTLDDAFVNHWGYVTAGDETAGTRHPHNIVLRNNVIGSLTTTTRDGGGVSVSAGYDITVDNLKIDRCRYPIYSTTGDFGFKYSGFTEQVMGAVSFKNVTCLYVYNAGALITSVDSDSAQHILNHVIDNCVLIGANSGGGQGGLWFDNVRGVTIRNTTLAGHEFGNVFTNGCQKILFDTCTFATNRLAGFIGSDPNTTDVTVRSCRFQNNSWGVSGTNAAAIRLLAGENFRILDNDIGNPISEPNQEVGIECIPGTVNATITGNRVLNVKSGGVDEGLYLGNSADSGHLWLVSGNSANATTLISGPQALPYAVRGKYRDFSAASAPTLGDFIKGDAIYLTEATSTPFALKVTVSGNPGTTVTMF